MNKCITDLRINSQGVLQYSTDSRCTWVSVGVVSGADGSDGSDGTDGVNGVTPHINAVSKHWMIGDNDTNIMAEGKDGDSPYINQDGYWVVEGVVTQYKAAGSTYDVQVAAGAHINQYGTASVVSSRDDVNKVVTFTFDYLKGATGDTPELTATQTFDGGLATGYDIMVGDDLLCHLSNGENGADGTDGADGDTISIVPDDETHSVSFYVNDVWKATINDAIQYTAGNGIAINDVTISVKYDDDTIKRNGTSGNLYVPTVSPTSKGVAPQGATVTAQDKNTKFLREDGSWAIPSYTDVPTERNELIYSDDGETLTTHPLMFEGGLVVDTPEDLKLCKTGADVSMSVILKPVSEGGWVAYGSLSDDKNQWGYCDSKGSGSSKTVTKVGGSTETVPIFKYKGAAQDYIFNTENTDENTGYYSPDTYDEFDSIITCGVLPSMQSGHFQDYMGIVPALTLKGEKDQNDYNYGIGIHVENESSNVFGRPFSAGGDDSGTTIQIVAFKQPDLNDTSSVTNINILTAPQGKTVIPYNSSLNNESGSQSLNTSCMQTRTIRKGNIITFYASDPYKVCTTDLNTYNDDYDFKDTIHLDRPITINLNTYIVTYVKADGTIGTNDYSTGPGDNATIREIFDKLKGSAHRGFEAESNPGTFFRNCTAHERIIDVTPGVNRVYDYDGSRWNWEFDTETSMPNITVGGNQYILNSETVSGKAPYKWENNQASPTEYYTKHPVPDITLTTPDVAYTSSAASDAGTAISAVNGVRLLPLKLFENGSRIAWNRLTDKLFYNNGASIYRIASSDIQALDSRVSAVESGKMDSLRDMYIHYNDVTYDIDATTKTILSTFIDNTDENKFVPVQVTLSNDHGVSEEVFGMAKWSLDSSTNLEVTVVIGYYQFNVEEQVQSPAEFVGPWTRTVLGQGFFD